jgi:hypothetical protein
MGLSLYAAILISPIKMAVAIIPYASKHEEKDIIYRVMVYPAKKADGGKNGGTTLFSLLSPDGWWMGISIIYDKEPQESHMSFLSPNLEDAQELLHFLNLDGLEWYPRLGEIPIASEPMIIRQVWIKSENLMHIDEWKKKQGMGAPQGSIRDYWMK